MTALQEIENCGKCVRKFIGDEERYCSIHKVAVLCKSCADGRNDISFPICGGREGYDYIFGAEKINAPWSE